MRRLDIENIVVENECECIRKCLDFAETMDLKILKSGRYAISGEDIYCNILTYETQNKESAFWEAHKIYIDLHLLISGSECIAVSDGGAVSFSGYSPENDSYSCLVNRKKHVILTAGRGLLLMPMEAHMTGITQEEKSAVKKAVFKIEASVFESQIQKSLKTQNILAVKR